MSVSIEEVRRIAGLARLEFSGEEEERLAREMSKILDYVELLKELDTDDVPPTSHVLDMTNVTRPDAANPRITRDEALRNGPDTDGTYFRVPKVIE